MKIFGEGEYMEIEAEDERLHKIPIQVDKISEYADSDRIQRKVREGAIMLVKVRELKDKNINELKRAVERIRRTTEAIGGEIVGAGDDWIIVSPSIAKIMR
ncbi:MAG: cell division protein SepF [Candidatus Aenigmarchaeota archaeon]|nr:cell division protein SepF [Candidatus Aenigmarchaeota archaeon]